MNLAVSEEKRKRIRDLLTDKFKDIIPKTLNSLSKDKAKLEKIANIIQQDKNFEVNSVKITSNPPNDLQYYSMKNYPEEIANNIFVLELSLKKVDK